EAAWAAVGAVRGDGALPEKVTEAARVIEEAGFTTIDDLLHGYGGGYLPPILGSASQPAGPVPDEPFRAGMTVVIQPNVVTPDGKAGVQTGELVLITERGAERMHQMPGGAHAQEAGVFCAGGAERDHGREGGRGRAGPPLPDFAALHPGYAAPSCSASQSALCERQR